MARTQYKEVSDKADASMVESFTIGFGEGVEDEQNGAPVPDFFFTKKLYMLKKYEEGYYLGRMVERAERYSTVAPTDDKAVELCEQ